MQHQTRNGARLIVPRCVSLLGLGHWLGLVGTCARSWAWARAWASARTWADIWACAVVWACV
eukprot:6602423-Alexandrium_andersonii.AAC.1